MVSYRVFVLDMQGEVTVGQDVTCPDDETALATARTILAGEGRAEVWQAARLVDQVTE